MFLKIGIEQVVVQRINVFSDFLKLVRTQQKFGKDFRKRYCAKPEGLQIRICYSSTAVFPVLRHMVGRKEILQMRDTFYVYLVVGGIRSFQLHLNFIHRAKEERTALVD